VALCSPGLKALSAGRRAGRASRWNSQRTAREAAWCQPCRSSTRRGDTASLTGPRRGARSQLPLARTRWTLRIWRAVTIGWEAAQPRGLIPPWRSRTDHDPCTQRRLEPFPSAGSLQAPNNRETCTGCHVDRPAGVRTRGAADLFEAFSARLRLPSSTERAGAGSDSRIQGASASASQVIPPKYFDRVFDRSRHLDQFEVLNGRGREKRAGKLMRKK
jgi:hypothetical protein